MTESGVVPRRCQALLAIGLLALTCEGAEPLRIVNRYLAVDCSTDGVLTIGAPGGVGPRVASFRFAHPVTQVERLPNSTTAWGECQVLGLTHENGWRSRIEVSSELPFVAVTTDVVNRGAAALRLDKIPFAAWRADCGASVSAVNAVGTGGVTPVADAEGSYTFTATADPVSRRGVVAGWLTHERGVGAFFPGVADGQAVTRAQIDAGTFLVEPRASRPTETLLIGCFADARLGLEAYAGAVAKHYAIRLPTKPAVYCTWYHAGASNQRDLTTNVEFAARELKPFGLSVMQIDDLWQRPLPAGHRFDVEPESIPMTGPVKVFTDANERFPDGMDSMARGILSSGMTPGLWFMPFAGNYRNPYFDDRVFARDAAGGPYHDERWSGTCIDLSSPEGEAFVRERVRRVYDWGYRYFKIDGMHTGLATKNVYINKGYREQDFAGARFHDPGVTPVEAYRRGLTVLREEGPEAYVLGCNVSQNMYSMGPAFGMIDAMRIGPDNNNGAKGRWNQVTLGAWHGSNLYFLNDRVWHNDPDPVYVRPGNPLNKARWMCSWVAVTGALHTSSEQYDRLPADRVNLLKRCLPSHSLPARPVDYLERDKPRLWHVSRDDRHVVGLFNWQENEPTRVRSGLDRIGLDGSKPYVGFEYWSDRFVGEYNEELRYEIPPASCAVLALRPAVERPQLIATSRHITQGLIDVLEEEWDAESQSLSGLSQVVAGDRYQLRIVAPEGWSVTSALAGDIELTTIAQPGDPPGSLRLEFVPTETDAVRWTVQFEKSPRANL